MEVTGGTEPLHRVRSPRRAGWAGCTTAAALTAAALTVAALTAAALTASAALRLISFGVDPCFGSIAMRDGVMGDRVEQL